MPPVHSKLELHGLLRGASRWIFAVGERACEFWIRGESPAAYFGSPDEGAGDVAMDTGAGQGRSLRTVASWMRIQAVGALRGSYIRRRFPNDTG